MSLETLHEYPLTPSEILLLREAPGESPSGWFVGRMLAAAFFANEAIQAIHFEMESRKHFLGLLTRENLMVFPGRRDIEWPSPSLEARIVELAQIYARRNGISVSDIVYKWMFRDSRSPWNGATRRVEKQLVSRRLLKKPTERRLRMQRNTSLSIPLQTRVFLDQAPYALINKAISDFHQEQPKVSQWLQSEVSKAIRGRQQRNVPRYFPG